MSKTEFVNSVTIVYDSYLNKMFGGLHGTPAGNLLDPSNPLVGGHIHDGQHIDGHAQKINLADHVTGLLDGQMIEDGTITEDKLHPDLLLRMECECVSATCLVYTTIGTIIFDRNGNPLTLINC